MAVVTAGSFLPLSPRLSLVQNGYWVSGWVLHGSWVRTGDLSVGNTEAFFKGGRGVGGDWHKARHCCVCMFFPLLG